MHLDELFKDLLQVQEAGAAPAVPGVSSTEVPPRMFPVQLGVRDEHGHVTHYDVAGVEVIDYGDEKIVVLHSGDPLKVVEPRPLSMIY